MNAASVDGFQNGQVVSLWGGVLPKTIPNGGYLILTGFNSTDFDSSDFPFTFANFPINESLQWRLIGTSGIDNPAGAPPGTGVAEPATLGVFGAVALCAAGLWRRKGG